MIKIVVFCDTTKTVSGIVMHCNSLKTLLESGGDFSVSVFSSLPYKRYFSLFNVYDRRAIENALTQDDIDIIHIHGFISTIPFLVASRMRKMGIKVPVVYTPHAHPFYSTNHPFRNRIFFHFFVRPVLKHADVVIAINKEDRAFFCKYNKNVVMIPHWGSSEAAQKKKQNDSRPMILFVGRNDANKNLRVMYALPQGKYEVVCVTNLKPERDDFVFKSRIPEEELNALYARASLTVVPSRYEAFSYTAMESLLAGTPVLLSNRVRITDFLEGVAGVTVYDYEKPEEFVRKIDEAMKQIVDIKKVRALFSADAAFSAYADVYEKNCKDCKKRTKQP